MRKILLYLSFVFSTLAIAGNNASQQGPLTCTSDKNAAQQEKYAEYPGGVAALYGFIAETMNYPDSTKRTVKEAVVLVKFQIGIDGKVSAIQIVKGVDAAFDTEALRIVSLMPQWTPGSVMKSGQCVPVVQEYTLPIVFSLTDK